MKTKVNIHEFIPQLVQPIFNGQEPRQIDGQLFVGGNVSYLVSVTRPIYKSQQHKQTQPHFFGLNGSHLMDRSKLTVLVLASSKEWIVLKIPSDFLKELPLYEDPKNDRFLLRVEYDLEAKEWVVLVRDRISPRISVQKFAHSLRDYKRLCINLGVKSMILGR
ncbi:hypothetical protein [Alicyclobacillus mengziensis]|uniref:Uncharacterized protein n=1 Tax=Alicyclobacillus mengziensis TaxID=2931921 RepID=A0A9X7VYP9_9BACL|nr:hypothetical protein [Alicyclobacillus mengziensis]QSO47481.1 hypothetical protein JZ786_24390 [Alicyclobacillus mengziensis]